MIAVPLKTGEIAGHRFADGNIMWKQSLAAEQSLAADDDRVYVAAVEAIHALDAKSGTVAWRTALGGAPTAPPLAHGGWVIAGASGEILALRASDGAVIWRQPVGAVKFRPALDGDLLVIPIAEGSILAVDVRDGKELWRAVLGSEPGEPLAIGGRIFVGTANKLLHRLNAANGRAYPVSTVGAEPRGRAAADDRNVYFAAMDNVVRAIDRGSGALRWKKGLTYRPNAGPVVLGSYVVVPGDVEALAVFDARTGTPVSSIAFSARRLATLPVFGQQDKLFALGITGELDEKWAVTLLEPSGVPAIAIEPLTTLPGEMVWMPQLPPPS